MRSGEEGDSYLPLTMYWRSRIARFSYRFWLTGQWVYTHSSLYLVLCVARCRLRQYTASVDFAFKKYLLFIFVIYLNLKWDTSDRERSIDRSVLDSGRWWGMRMRRGQEAICSLVASDMESPSRQWTWWCDVFARNTEGIIIIIINVHCRSSRSCKHTITRINHHLLVTIHLAGEWAMGNGHPNIYREMLLVVDRGSMRFLVSHPNRVIFPPSLSPILDRQQLQQQQQLHTHTHLV